MTTYSWDDQPLRAPSAVELNLVTNDASLPSALNGAIQTVSRPGTRLEMSLTWRGIFGDERQDLLAFFARLNGKEHRVRLPIFNRQTRGAYGGSPLVDGGGQTGNSLNIKNASASVTDWAKAGDIFRWGGSIHILTTDADTDGSGDATLNFVPEIRTSPADNTALVTGAASPTGIFILDSPVPFGSDVSGRLPSGDMLSNITLSFIDDVSAE